MEPSENNRIQELSISDLENCFNLTQASVAALVTDAPPQESLNEALRQIRMLRRPAPALQTSGLADLAADYGNLLKVAGPWMSSDREKANEIFQFILDHQQDWFLMNQFTGMEMFSEAWDIYQGLRVVMEERWSSYLSTDEFEEEPDYASIQPDDSELIAEPQPVPEPAPEVTVQLPSITSLLQPAIPTLLNLVPPTLRPSESPGAFLRESAPKLDRDERQDNPITQSSNPVKSIPSLSASDSIRGFKSSGAKTKTPARPMVLPVLLPTLRRAETRSMSPR